MTAGPCLETRRRRFAVESKVDSNLDHVLWEIFVAPAGEEQIVFYHSLGIFLLNVLHGDLSTLS